jgi:hypothetical protein
VVTRKLLRVSVNERNAGRARARRAFARRS